MDVKKRYLQLFIEFSAFATGFSQVKLIGTGISNEYYDAIELNVGGNTFHEMLDVFKSIEGKQDKKVLFYDKLFSNPEYGLQDHG